MNIQRLANRARHHDFKITGCQDLVTMKQITRGEKNERADGRLRRPQILPCTRGSGFVFDRWPLDLTSGHCGCCWQSGSISARKPKRRSDECVHQSCILERNWSTGPPCVRYVLHTPQGASGRRISVSTTPHVTPRRSATVMSAVFAMPASESGLPRTPERLRLAANRR
jgi:hypothetical protein